jgi:hypothetical protein
LENIAMPFSIFALFVVSKIQSRMKAKGRNLPLQLVNGRNANNQKTDSWLRPGFILRASWVCPASKAPRKHRENCEFENRKNNSTQTTNYHTSPSPPGSQSPARPFAPASSLKPQASRLNLESP